MEAPEVKKWLLGIIRQRKKLLQIEKCKVNKEICAKICERLEKLLLAYPYNNEKIFFFIRRNYYDITFIIPGNRSSKKNIEILTQCMNKSEIFSASINARQPEQLSLCS